MKISKTIALVAISFSCLTASEPSAFGAGDLNAPKPYGLTTTESTILETKKDLQKISAKSNNQANQVDSLRERVDGLQTILEGITASNHANKSKLTALEEKNTKEHKDINEYNKRLTDLVQEQSKLVESNKANIDKINVVLSEIYKVIDSINGSYVTKEELKKLLGDINKNKGVSTKDTKQEQQDKPKQDKKENTSASNVDIEKDAAQAFKDKDYTKAKEKYKHLAEQNYKPAKSNYMLGEIEYYRKNYSDAVSYFKKSATLSANAEYMPVLLLHTAMSMDESGDKANAQNFYSAVVSKYPNSNEAKLASKKIKR